MKHTSIGIISAAAMYATIGVSLVHATAPTFPTCVNPEGTIKVQYSSGIHGVPGQYSEKRGSDVVYQLSGNDKVMQCFCADNGNGVQTNWVKASLYTEDQIKVLKNEGWIYIPEGTAWGLDSGAYLAKNADYACKTTSGQNNSNSSNSSSSSNGVGSSNPIKSVLSLANTGNIAFLYSLLAIGTVSFIAGFILRWNKK